MPDDQAGLPTSSGPIGSPSAAPPTTSSTDRVLLPEEEAVRAHLNLLQGVINRMAGNSASCKTWCITLVTALLAFAADKHAPHLAWGSVVAVITFCFLDVYYLAQERGFRESYKTFLEQLHARQATTAQLYWITPAPVFSIRCSTLKSIAILPVYLVLLALSIGTACWLGWGR